MTIFSNTHKYATVLGCRALLVGALGAFAGSGWALPPAPMEVNPVNPDDCIIYATNQVGPLPKFGVLPPTLADTFAANICSEGDIRFGVNKVTVPKGDTPPYLVNNTVALAAGGLIDLQKGNLVLETHTLTLTAANLIIDARVANPPPVATRFDDLTPGSFTGTGIAFPAIDSTGADGDIICKKNRLRVPNLSGKVTVTALGIEVQPGNYGAFQSRKCNIIFVPDAVDPTAPLDYTFDYMTSGATSFDFTNKPAGTLARLLVEKFFSQKHPGSFNTQQVEGVTIWIAGADSGFGGINRNAVSAVTGLPSVFQNGGDATFYACHVYAKNGTISMRGHGGITTRFLGMNIQKAGGSSVNIDHPEEICDSGVVTPVCGFIRNIACDATTLTLQSSGSFFDNTNVSGLAIWEETAAIPIADPTASALSSIDAAGLTFFPSGAALTLPLSALGGGLPANATVKAYVGLIGPLTAPSITQGHYVKTDQLLELQTDGGGNITACTVVAP